MVVTQPVVKVKFKCLSEKAVAPKVMSEGAAGADLCTIENAVLMPGERLLLSTGLSVAIPFGYEGQVRPRSGHCWKKGLTVLNAPGTIDSDYRGEVKVMVVNLSQEVVEVDEGERVAQIVIAPVPFVDWTEVEELDETVRGAGGFGSTGSAGA
jgi:dUTP pyrophosphatase